MEQNVLYRSFEEYATIRLERITDATPSDLKSHPEHSRSYATKERQKIETMTAALGITLELFKKNGTYLMTVGCCELFDYLLTGYESSYGKYIRKGLFSDVPETFLIQIRALLFDALRDAGVPNDEIQAELQYFETRTGCPQRIISIPLSEPVQEALELCHKYIDATKHDWDMVADCVELQYLKEIKPHLMEFLVVKIQKQLDAIRHAKDLPCGKQKN